jgi:hypothetical protein
MRIVVKDRNSDLITQLQNAVNKTREDGREVDYIELTPSEFEKLKDYVGSNFCRTSSSYLKDAYILGYPVKIVKR